MSRLLRCAVLFAALFAGAALLAAAQPTPPAKGKGGAEPEKKKSEPKKVDVKPRPPLDRMTLPPEAVVVVVEEIQKALRLMPRAVVLTPEEYQSLLERVRALEKKLKQTRKLTHSCKLVGKLDGEFVALRAEFTFSTELPRTTVLLGLQGAHLIDEGELDREPAALEFTAEDGFHVRVDKPGNHHLVVNLRAPVERKKAAGGAERGFKIELPGAAVTSLALELPGRVRELRWNGNLEKDRVGGRWYLGDLGRAKSLGIAWRDSVTLPGNGPLASAEGLVNVRLDETHVLLKADLTLEDLRGQTKEWRLHLPAAAKIDEVRHPAGAGYELVPPDGKRPYYILRLDEASAEPWRVTVLVRQPRPAPGTRLAVGPFYVVGAYRQQGKITIQASAEALRGQRLAYHHTGDVFQRDPPRGPGTSDVEAVFHYWSLPAPNGKGPRVPLELELRAEKGQVETRLAHTLKLHRSADGWEIALTTRIQGKATLGGGDTLDVLLPRPRPRGVAPLASAPMATFPAGLPWAVLYEAAADDAARALPLDFRAHEEKDREKGGALDLVPLDVAGRARITWPRVLGQDFVAVLTSRYLIPRTAGRARIELPRVAGTLDRGATLTLRADPDLELFIGPPRAEEPVPDRHSYQAAWEQAPAAFALSWKPRPRELAAMASADVQLHARTAEVRQRLTFAPPTRAGVTGQLKLRVPETVRTVEVLAGGTPNGLAPEGGFFWVTPTRAGEQVTLELRYDLELPAAGAGAPGALAARTFALPLVWPAGVTRCEATARVWAPPGMRVVLETPPGAALPAWRERGIEPAAGRAALPALAARGDSDAPLPLRLEEAEAALAGLLCDRALFEVAIDDEGAHVYRARFALKAAGAEHVDVEFPLDLAECAPAVAASGAGKLHWEPIAARVARVRLPVPPPALLEIQCKLPAVLAERRGPWLLTAQAPTLRGVTVKEARWLVSVPTSRVALAGGTARPAYRWTWQGWLFTPCAAAGCPGLESWLVTGRTPAGGDGLPGSFTLTRAGQGPQRLYLMPRPIWLLLCSGTLLVLALGLLYAPMAMSLRLAGAVLALLAALSLALWWPALLPPLALGLQPGLVILVLVILVQKLLQERYRRQVVFLPSFTRAGGSSVGRNGSRRTREASTIDSPVGPTAPAPSEQG